MTQFTSLDSEKHSELYAAVHSVIHNATRADGIPPLSEQFLLGLGDSRLGHTHFYHEGALAALAPSGDVELVVDPARRREGLATMLMKEVEEAAGEQNPKYWAHGNIPAAQALAAKRGLVKTRELFVMGRDVSPAPTDDIAQFAPGLVLLNLAQSKALYGEDFVMENWLRVNNEAFDWHPEQGGWDRARLERALEAEWVDPNGIFLLWAAGQEDSKPELLGFHWTKMEKATEEATEDSENTSAEDTAAGEVYVVGLANAARGKGLGGPLTMAGVHYLEAKLRARGGGRVVLYVEHDNVPAVRLYEQLGFSVIERHTVYSHSA
ncbi:MAG: mycothiol synthase [Corynebacterium sp.]|nr:mycothiol synthase [Corynebacterium sp.]